MLSMTKEKKYDTIDYWIPLGIELHCMINAEYSSVCDKYIYEYSSDIPIEKWKRIDNPYYDPNAKPNKFPRNCKKKLGIDCLDCRYVGYVEMEEATEEDL